MRAGGLRVLALLLTSAFLSACTGQEAARQENMGAPVIADILGDPAQCLGQELTLSGEVGNTLSSRRLW